MPRLNVGRELPALVLPPLHADWVRHLWGGALATALLGLIEALAAAPYNGRADLPLLAAHLQMEIDDLFPVAETLQMKVGSIGPTRGRCLDKLRAELAADPRWEQP